MSFALLKPAYSAGAAVASYRYTTQPKLYWVVYASSATTPTAEQVLAGYTGTAVLAGFEDARTDSGDHELAPIDITGVAAGTYQAAIVWYDGETFSAVSETADFDVGAGSVFNLTISDASHGHTADVVALSAVLNLLIADALHSHLADAAALDTSSAANLTTADASHDHSVDALLLSAAHTLLTADSAHGHTAEALTLGSLHNLTVSDASHAHTANAQELATGIALAVQDSFHGHLADGVTLDTALTLAISDAMHAHEAEAQLLTAELNLLIADAVHGHLAGSVTMYLPVAATDLLRKSIFLRLETYRATVRVETKPQVFTRH